MVYKRYMPITYITLQSNNCQMSSYHSSPPIQLTPFICFARPEPCSLLGSKSESVSCSVASDLLQPHGLQPARLLCPWDFAGKNTGVSCHILLQRIFLTQGLNPGLPYCRLILYHLSYQGSPLVNTLVTSSLVSVYMDFILFCLFSLDSIYE